MGTELFGYRILNEEEAKFGTIYYAEREGTTYVIKRFNDYRFPDEDCAGQPFYEDSVKKARMFLEHLTRIRDAFQRNCRMRGPLNIPAEIIRDGSFMYKVTLVVEDCRVKPGDVYREFTRAQVDTILRSVLLQLEKLAECGFIHCDIKPENIMIRRKKGCCTGALIDYEGGFFTDSLHESMVITHTPEYAAPEMLLYEFAVGDEESPLVCEEAAKLTHALDVYALGCVYAQYLTGMMLCHDDTDERFVEPGMLQINNVPLYIPRVDPVRRALIEWMTRKDPHERPTPGQAISFLNAAHSAGLAARLEEPFELLRGSDVKPLGYGVPFSDANVVKAVAIDGRRYALVHLQDDWLSDGEETFAKHDAAARRRRKRRAEVRGALEKHSGKSGALLPFRLLFVDAAAFAAVPLPYRKNARFAEAGALQKKVRSAAEMDDIMCTLLDAVGVLHGAGYVHGAITHKSFWFVVCDGAVTPFVNDAYRAFRSGEPPMPEDFAEKPFFMPPEIGIYAAEQLEPQKSGCAKLVAQTADIYSLGLVYHLMLCGELPGIAGGGDAEYPVLYRAARDDTLDEPLVLISPAIDTGRASIIRRMTRYWPQDRYHDCRAVSDEIKRLARRSR